MMMMMMITVTILITCLPYFYAQQLLLPATKTVEDDCRRLDLFFSVSVSVCI